MCAAVYHLVKATEVTSRQKVTAAYCRVYGVIHVTCRLTACTLGSAPGPTLGNEYGKTLPLPFLSFLERVRINHST